MKEITLEQYVMGRDKQYPDEWTEEIKNNAINLLKLVNSLLSELGIEHDIEVSSGWRPPQINNKITNAAKMSGHMIGKSIDLKDNEKQDLGKLIASRPDLLRKYGLFLEDLGSTKGKNTNWVHLDFLVRADRPTRIFKP